MKIQQIEILFFMLPVLLAYVIPRLITNNVIIDLANKEIT